MKISDYIGETTAYDKKVAIEEKKPKSWLKSVSAFANGNGGALFFGIDDEGELVGLENFQKDSEKVSEFIKTRLDPVPDFELKIHEEDGKKFILLFISSGIQTPYYYVADGNRIAFVHIGNESVKASREDLNRLVLQGFGKTYDALVSVYPYEDYAFTKLRTVYRMQTGNTLTDMDFLSFNLMDESGRLTHAGALLADESPLSHSRLFCTRWNGLDKASGILDALDDKEYTGSLITLLQNGEEFIKNNTKKRWYKTSSGRIELPDIPERAAMECLVNALIHRDYLDLGSEVHIDIFDDRVEIYSPGGMSDGSFVQDLNTDLIPSKRRNPIIADVFSRLRLMERRGSGFRKIKEDYHRRPDYRPELEPKFYSTTNAFFVTLYNLNYKDSNVSSQREKVTFKPKEVMFEPKEVTFEPEELILEPEEVTLRPQDVPVQTAQEILEAHLEATAWTRNTKEKIKCLYTTYGQDSFSRADIVRLVGHSYTAAGKLISKLKEAGLIEKVADIRGGYRFKALKKS